MADGEIGLDGLIANFDRCNSVHRLYPVEITLTVCSIPCPNHWMKPTSGCCVILTMAWSNMPNEFWHYFILQVHDPLSGHCFHLGGLFKSPWCGNYCRVVAPAFLFELENTLYGWHWRFCGWNLASSWSTWFLRLYPWWNPYSTRKWQDRISPCLYPLMTLFLSLIL